MIRTAYDAIPNCAASPSNVSVRSGMWSDPTVWSADHVPAQGEILAITEGTTVTFDVSSNAAIPCMAIESGGKLTFRPNVTTSLPVGTLIVFEGGTLEVGTIASPILSSVTASIIFTDTPIDTSVDPKQYTQGLIGLGTVTMVGAARTPTFTELTAEPIEGSMTLSLAQIPAGWQVGDLLMLPDTRYVDPAATIGAFSYTQSETMTIRSINGSQVTLSTPLQYSHLGAHDPAGTLRFLPHVANLSRNVIVRSANPSGTRGHTFFTQRAAVKLHNVLFQDLGRTTNDLIDSTTFNADGGVAHIGANQLGRYAVHFHHLMGPVNASNTGYQFQLQGSAIVNSRKWALTVHESHFGLIEQNLVYGAQGSGIATEDGSESYNLFNRNFVSKVLGVAGSTDATTLVEHDVDGSKGNGFWAQGSHNSFTDNVIAATRRSGFVTYAPNKLTGSVPRFRGADILSEAESEQVQLNSLVPLEQEGTIAYATFMGLNAWYHSTPYTVTNSIVWNPGRSGVEPHYTQANTRFAGLTLIGGKQGGDRSAYGAIDNAYTSLQIQAPCDILGFQGGLSLDMLQPADITGCVLENVENVHVHYHNHRVANGRTVQNLRNLRFSAMPGFPLKNIALFFDPGQNHWTGWSDIHVYDYNGQQGNNFGVFFPEQAPGVVIPIDRGCPGGSMTNQRCWDLHRVATAGSVAFCSDTASHPEIDGFTCKRGAGLTNTPPIVTLSASTPTFDVNRVGSLLATARDDGLPYPPGLLSRRWSKVTGPGEPTFREMLDGATQVSVTAPGTYVLRFTASDGTLSTSADTTIVVTGTAPSSSSSSIANLPPLTISTVQVSSITRNSAAVTWSTNNASSTQVIWGLVEDTYTDSSDVNQDPVLNHAASLSGLLSATTYHLRVRSIDGAGHIAISDDITLRTAP